MTFDPGMETTRVCEGNHTLNGVSQHVSGDPIRVPILRLIPTDNDTDSGKHLLTSWDHVMSFSNPCCVCVCVFSGDDTLKTWDIRSFRKPLGQVTGLTSFFPM